ncbi:HEAT repeat domain-containing protein [Microcoleus sp. EPA2]|uniref:HEAT repeat domain-containing protein n=1 Tax=Microcoleus sp. EPA2 TaxID=2841654 RepID=UPI00312B9295
MSDPITLGLLFTVAWQAILGTQVNDAAKHLCLTGIKNISRNGKIVNHDLEKALKTSFLKAQQQIASECKQEIDPKNTANRESFAYSLQDRRRDFDWLKRKLEKLKLELEQVNKETVPSGIPIAGLDEIELLLTAKDELKQNQVEKLKQKLLEVALENCDVAPYKTKLEQELFDLLSAYFAQEVKENDKVFQIFTGQSLTRIDSTTQEMHAWLQEIVEKSRIVYQPIDWRDICQQILDEKEQQRLSSDRLTFGSHQIDDVYVPLGLVERHKVTQQRENFGAEEGSDLYREKEVTQTFEHSEFLEQVIQQGISPKSDGKRLGIIGEPGAGKTTLLRQIGNWVAAGISEAMVIWVSLADLQGKELETYLFDNWLLAAIKRIGKAEATADIKDDFLAQFNADRVWLVLDGADEMAVGDGNPLAEIERQIRTGGCIQRARIVLSCRQNVWDAIGSALDSFDTYRTLEFSYPEQVEMFIDKWFGTLANPQFGTPPSPPLVRGGTREEGETIDRFGTPPNPPLVRGGTREDGEQIREDETLAPPLARGAGGVLSQQLPEAGETLAPPLARGAGGDLSKLLREALAAPGKERIRDLVKNPLRCSLLCGTWQSLDGDLPDTKAKLYRRFVTTLYQWKKPHLNWIQQQDLNAALGKLALSGMLNETARFQLRESVGYRLMGASQFELACRLGWLNLVARDGETLEGIYAFYHPTFQEYFAALAVEDWHFFLNHIPPEGGHGGTAPTRDGVYRIFEKQWKEVILLWLGREEVGKEEKEGFIKALVEFEDGCHDFYGYRAYFLAAAGIAEFKDCSLADEIVSQVIKWGFGYFNEEKQQWWTFIAPLAEGSWDILKETDEKRAISALAELIRNSGNEETRWIAANILGEIDKDNPVAIEALVELIRTSQDENTRREAANSLGKIGKDNPVAISALVELIHNSGDEGTELEAAHILRKIGKDNPVVISALVELIRNSGDEDTRWIAAYSLGEIDKDNPVAITALVELIRNSDDEDTRMRAADSLGKIDKDNPVAITALVELIRNSGNEDTRIEAVYSLGKIGKDNPVAIAALVESIRNSDDENPRTLAASSLGKIGKDNPVVISALVELIRNSGDESTRRRLAAYSLGEIDKDNPVAIAALVELIRNSDDEKNRRQAADSLGKIGKDNPVAIQALVELIRNSDDEKNRRQAAYSLGKISKDNPVAIQALVELIRTSQDESTRRHAADSLGKIMKGKHFATAVSGLKDCLTSEISENDFTLYHKCCLVLSDCAENMTYPEFYQAWHTQPTNSPIPDRNHRQNTDIPTLLKQLQPTDKTCPVPLNIRALEGETDTSPIAQELCTQLYQTIFPADTDIPAIRNAPEFKRLIPQLKNRLQKQHIALILHSCPCEDALSSFTRKLADSHMGIHIAWITDTPLELPLTGFAADADDLFDAVHNWIEAIG